MAGVDESRGKLINKMTADQKDMFLIGMSYHSAYLTYAEEQRGSPIGDVCAYELKMVREAMARQGLKTELTAEVFSGG